MFLPLWDEMRALTVNLDDALEQVDWASTLRRLTLYAKRRLGTEVTIEEAEDIAAEAVRQMLDPTYRGWDPQREQLLWHLQSNVNGLISNRRRKKALSEERLHDFSAKPDVGMSPAPDPLPSISLADLARHATALGDHLAAAVVAAAIQGSSSPKEVALSLGVPAQKVYDARQRLKRYAVALQRDDGDTP